MGTIGPSTKRVLADEEKSVDTKSDADEATSPEHRNKNNESMEKHNNSAQSGKEDDLPSKRKKWA